MIYATHRCNFRCLIPTRRNERLPTLLNELR
nr:MAG TPA: Radical SAM domain protein, CteA SAM binding, metalloprotein, SCIFF [Caudoviricetes sp.]